VSPMQLSRWRVWVCLLVGIVGCGTGAPVDDRLRALDPKALVPVDGLATINGKPVAKVVVTFLPPSGPAIGTAETDEHGKYELQTMGSKGVLPGNYKIAISYMVSDKGVPQGMTRSGAFRSNTVSFTERLPAEYADLGRTKLSAKVGPQGGNFNFDVLASIPALEEKTAAKNAQDTPPAKKTPEEKE
jgi:hypothetical protein